MKLDPRVTEALVSAMRPTLETALARNVDVALTETFDVLADIAIERYIKTVCENQRAVNDATGDVTWQPIPQVLRCLEGGDPGEVVCEIDDLAGSDLREALPPGYVVPNAYSDMLAGAIWRRANNDELALRFRGTDAYKASQASQEARRENVELQWVDTTDQANPRILSFDEVEELGLDATLRSTRQPRSNHE